MIDFGDAVQVFHIGASSCGVYGMPAGIASAAERFGTVPLADLAAPAIALARDGLEVNETQGYLWELLGADRDVDAGVVRPLLHRRPRAARGRGRARSRTSPTGIARLAADGAAPFYSGDIGTRGLGLGDEPRRDAHARATSRPTRPSRASRCASATTAARC